jgi:hypothetical protein
VAPLKNQRRELFAQALARGNTTDDAYAQAGFSPNRGNAARLKANEDILARVLELQEQAEKRFYLTKQYVIDALIENIQKALGRRPVRLGKPKEDGSFDEVYVYEGAAANAAIRLAGAEMSMFTERRDVTVKNEYAHLTDEQLAQKLVEIGQQVLLGSLEGPVIEHEGLDRIGGSPSVSPEPRRRSRNL